MLLTSNDEELKKKLSAGLADSVPVAVAAPLATLSSSKKPNESTSQITQDTQVSYLLFIYIFHLG